MVCMSRLQFLRRRLRELRTANGANVTITFALATVPVVGFVGAAVDYSHANAVKASMQMAADSTALMLSKTAALLTISDIETKAGDYFKALITRTDTTGMSVTAAYSTTGGSKIVITASTTVKTSFMGLMGFSSLPVKVSSQVKWGNTKLRVALVLDVTGSMYEDGKIAALKTATKNLLDKLKDAATTNGDVYVSIIPFSKDVNVGSTNYTATWIDWTDWEATNGDCSRSGSAFSNKSVCEATPKCSKTQYTTENSCEDHSGHWYTTPGTWTPNNRNTWNGCVTDRGTTSAPSVGNYDTNVTTPDIAVTATLFPAEQYGSCPDKIMGLNYDWTAMKTMIDGLDPNGNTNQGIGLVHGWQSLVGGGPYPAPPAEDPNYKYTKVIILMSDGLNTQNRWYSSQSSIDAREAMTCVNAKAAGITIYAVQVNTGGDPTQTVMKNCAGDAAKFFELKSANALIAAFDSIGTALTNLRIAQ